MGALRVPALMPLSCRLGRYRYRAGTTAVLSEKVELRSLEVLEEHVQSMDVE